MSQAEQLRTNSEGWYDGHAVEADPERLEYVIFWEDNTRSDVSRDDASGTWRTAFGGFIYAMEKIDKDIRRPGRWMQRN